MNHYNRIIGEIRKTNERSIVDAVEDTRTELKIDSLNQVFKIANGNALEMVSSLFPFIITEVILRVF